MAYYAIVTGALDPLAAVLTSHVPANVGLTRPSRQSYVALPTSVLVAAPGTDEGTGG